ncbi:MAG: universal stress protein, partial [Anaerolineae bacterium]|nr:universal stress protein [Anaerolineae bacterium]
MAYSNFRVLVAVGQADQLSPLLSFACALTKAQPGSVTLLCVTPDGERPDWLYVPVQCQDLDITVTVHAGDRADQVILDAARDLDPNLLLMGWRGVPGETQYLLGSTLDPVTRYAPCDVAVVRIRQDDLGEIRSILVPMSSGPNAPLAMEMALQLSDVHVTALNIARESLGPAARAAGYAQLRNALASWAYDERVSAKVVLAPGVIEGILEEATPHYDMVMIGATNESYIDRKLFGNVPQTVAAEASISTVIVRRHAGLVKTLFRQAELQLTRVQDSLPVTEQAETYREVRNGARARPDFYVLIAMAAAVATLGLLMNSPAV